MDGRRVSRLAGSVILLCLAGLYYLQFGLQALDDHLLQGLLSLVGAIALGWGAVRRVRQGKASSVVFFGTLPILILHGVLTIEDRGELPFLIGSIPVPLVAALAMLWDRRRQ